MPLHLWLHAGRRHQANDMTKRLEFTRPIMCRRAGFDTDQAQWQLLKERQHIAAFELPAEKHIALRIDTVDLKNRLRDVETDIVIACMVLSSSESWEP